MLSFIDHYFSDADFNAIKAVELSDYKCKTKASVLQTASELMNHPLILAEVKRRTDLRTQKSEIKAEWLLNKLVNIINATEADNPNAALRAIELAGKSIALWTDKQEVSGPNGGAIQHEQKVKEDVADFTSRIASLAKRNGTSNVVPLRPTSED
ncbi:MAG: hypothetical protein B7Z80_02735 [Rhodospirillales bacterium 20-64-7]|nr:MAG: hypothetical protein B7Z80_02735 [Rhodospirillales bacterium 20-64-7]